MKTTYDIFRAVIDGGKFVLLDMDEKLDSAWIMGKITTAERVELSKLAAERADDSRQIDITAALADLENRVSVLESAGVRVWVSGMSTARGQTVLYDVIKEGRLRYCRYDGGREATSLSPGRIDGWVILSGAGGDVTHTVQHDESGQIILVPVEPVPDGAEG